MIFKHTPLAERLEWHSMPEPNSGCLLWLSYVNKGGYGVVGWRRKTALAHRVAWELKNGPIPLGLYACHKCDVRSCINPSHMFLGTHKDNADDKVAKGRSGRVPNNKHRARLSLDQVKTIRSDPRCGRELARAFGVSYSTISMVRNGRTWREEESGYTPATQTKGEG